MQSYYINPREITALKKQVQKWSSTSMFMQLLCYANQSLTRCFSLLHVLFHSLLSLGNASYRKIARFPWPLCTLKAKAYMYKNTVIHSKTKKIGLQCLLEGRMAHTLAVCSLWQSTVTWQHCPKMFYNGRKGRKTNHTTHTIIPASNSFCLCNFMRSKRMTKKGNNLWPVSCSGAASATVKYKQEIT